MSARILLACLFAAMFATPGRAVITQVRATPPRASVAVSQGSQVFTLNWVVDTDVSHTLGAVSGQGNFVNAATGAVVAPPVIATIGSPAGNGPLTFGESITISGAQVETWRAQGIRVVGYRRTFFAQGGPPVSAQWLLQIRGAGLAGAREALGGELAIQRMDLSFREGERVALIRAGEALRARVAIGYSGSGTLRGRWEVAEPGSRGGEFFRVLSLVRAPLPGGMPVTLESPVLPVLTTGRHALRFCVEVDAADACESSPTAVQTFYEVLPAEETQTLRGLTPRNQPLGAGGKFRWPDVPGAAIYQLQIFTPARAPDTEPTFVTGLLLPGAEQEAPPSALVLRKLRDGQLYLWRVTAHDGDGRLLAGSELTPFTFRP